jgi:hypothetical protein
MQRETDLILWEHAFLFKGCVSLNISKQCDKIVFIPHTKENRMFVSTNSNSFGTGF